MHDHDEHGGDRDDSDLFSDFVAGMDNSVSSFIVGSEIFESEMSYRLQSLTLRRNVQI